MPSGRSSKSSSPICSIRSCAGATFAAGRPCHGAYPARPRTRPRERASTSAPDAASLSAHAGLSGAISASCWSPAPPTAAIRAAALLFDVQRRAVHDGADEGRVAADGSTASTPRWSSRVTIPGWAAAVDSARDVLADCDRLERRGPLSVRRVEQRGGQLHACSHRVRGGKGFGTPGMLDYLGLRQFRPTIRGIGDWPT